MRPPSSRLSSLKELLAQLQDDLQDNSDAVKLLTRCITWEVSTPCSQLPAAQYKLNHVSRDKSHSKYLKLKADNLLVDSMSFRGILQFSLTNVRQHLLIFAVCFCPGYSFLLFSKWFQSDLCMLDSSILMTTTDQNFPRAPAAEH